MIGEHRAGSRRGARRLAYRNNLEYISHTSKMILSACPPCRGAKANLSDNIKHSMSPKPARSCWSCQQLSHFQRHSTTAKALLARAKRTRPGRRPLQVSAALSVAAANPWRVWACLTCAGAAGLWCESEPGTICITNCRAIKVKAWSLQV